MLPGLQANGTQYPALEINIEKNICLSNTEHNRNYLQKVTTQVEFTKKY